MQTIAIVSRKGGVGKTATAQMLGAGLRIRGAKVLFVDLDSQQNLTFSVGASSAGVTAIDILTRESTARAALQRTAQGDVIAASGALAAADTIITGDRKEYRLKMALATL